MTSTGPGSAASSATGPGSAASSDEQPVTGVDQRADVAVVALVGTLDTKGAEYAWLADRLRAAGVETIVVDAGSGEAGEHSRLADITASTVASRAGARIEALREARDRGRAVTAMGEGAAWVLAELEAEGRLDGVLAVAGSGGSSIAARAVRDLPVGLPKMIVSTMAAGDVAPYVGDSDVTMTYSVVDVAGINKISRAVLDNAVAGIVGMAKAHRGRRSESEATEAENGDRPLIAASMFGVTTAAVDVARERLTELGYEVLVFHATGSGGRALEKLASTGVLVGVLDLTVTELADDLVGGVLSAGPDRLTAAGAAGLPQVVSLGALDMVNFGPRDTVPESFADRLLFVHNPTVTLMRTTVQECAELGDRVGRKLSAARGRTVLIVPRGGVSAIDVPGQPFHDPLADEALFDAVIGAVAGSAVEVIEVDTDVNNAELARSAAEKLHQLITAETD